MLALASRASAYTITAQISPSPYTDPASIPFSVDALGKGPANSFDGSGTITTGGATISFTPGTEASGVYDGNVTNLFRSPFGDTDSTDKYLVAGGGGGAVTLTYAAPQTSFDLLWGTVDTAPGQNTLMTFDVGGQTITGAEIAAAAGLTASGQFDVAVEITELTPFTTIVASNTAADAFEFDPGIAWVPEPASFALLGDALVGFGLLRRLRRA